MRTYTKKKELVNALNKKSLWERIVEELKRNYILYRLVEIHQAAYERYLDRLSNFN